MPFPECYIDATALTGSYFGNGTGPYHLSRVDCIGVESTLLECSYYHSDVGTHACAGGHDAGIRCDGMIIILLLRSHILRTN